MKKENKKGGAFPGGLVDMHRDTRLPAGCLAEFCHKVMFANDKCNVMLRACLSIIPDRNAQLGFLDNVAYLVTMDSEEREYNKEHNIKSKLDHMAYSVACKAILFLGLDKDPLREINALAFINPDYDGDIDIIIPSEKYSPFK